MLLTALAAALSKVPSTIRLGELEVATPFRSNFQTFLADMEARHANLTSWAQTLLGVSDGKKDETAAEWLLGLVGDVAEWGWENIGEEALDVLAEVTGMPDQQTMMQTRAMLGVDAQWDFIWDEFKVQFAEEVLVPLYRVTQIGKNFREALEGDDKWWALAGVAFGMAEASPLGTFLDITIAAWQYSTDVTNQTIGTDLHIPDDIKNWRDVSNMNSAYQAGVAIGQFGMSVSDLVVGVASVPAGPPPRIISFRTVASEAFVAEAEAVVVMPLSRAQALGLVGGGYGAAYLAEMAGNGDGDGPKSDGQIPQTPGDGPPWKAGQETPGGRRLTKHAAEDSLERHGFSNLAQVDEIIDSASRVRIQEDGAKVYIQRIGGRTRRYNIVIIEETLSDGDVIENVVTAIRDLSPDELRRIGNTYGFDPNP